MLNYQAENFFGDKMKDIKIDGVKGSRGKKVKIQK
jgi:hypothetical protein